MKKRPTIGLAMIVKNEEHVIRRCLESVLPLVDFVAISDTGSTDKTIAEIQHVMAATQTAYVLDTTEWIDFATNRNRACSLQMPAEIDYVFMIDADDRLEIAPGFDVAAFKNRMTHDLYEVHVKHMSIVHWRPQIFRNIPKLYYWRGVVHEFLVAPPDCTRERVAELVVHASIEGSRNRDKDKFLNDAKAIEAALKDETEPYLRARYQFYLAQSYRDAGNVKEGMKHYLRRAQMGHWDQEIYISLVETIRAYGRLDEKVPVDKVVKIIDIAGNTCSWRAEHIAAGAAVLRKANEHQKALDLARTGMNIPEPHGLFVEPWIYQYGVADEYEVAAYWAGDYIACLRTCLILIGSGRAPPDLHKRLADNALSAFDKMLTTEPPKAQQPSDVDEGVIF
jgi:glycosyltransferase involved in cell wall biosynthesis